MTQSAPTSGSLRVSNIVKRFDAGDHFVEVLHGATLALDAGDALAITGPSGSGKSTLLHIIGTLDRPSSGDVTINGVAPFALSEPELARFRNGTIGFIFQDHHLLPHYSVLENVLLPTLAHRDSSSDGPQDATERARMLLERVGLDHRMHHRPAQISGGERQRAAVARALINRPSLLLCDEPTGSLDHANADAVGDLLTELNEDSATILVVVTHSLELAARFPRRVELREGLVVDA